MNKKITPHNFIEACELPKDVLLGASIISVTGDEDILIENFKNIIKYSETSILIQCKKYQVQIEGKNLWIEVYSKEEIKVKGILYEIKFLSRKKELL